MVFTDAKILQFAKAPCLGEVKTRLQPGLSAESALELHCCLVEHTFKRLNDAELAPVELWVSAGSPFFDRLVADFTGRTEQQRGEDLGARMFHALSCSLATSDYAIIVGSDCPLLDTDYLRVALEQLDAGTPVVVGPAYDGGYVLVGMREPVATVFERIAWGSARVMEQTRQRCEEAGLPWSELPMLWDIDRYADLQKLKNVMSDAPEQFAAFSSLRL